jgi:hypothetical protein
MEHHTLTEYVGKMVNRGQSGEAVIIDAKREFFGKGIIVLCLMKGRPEFVTWWMNEEMQTFHGHYTLSLADATKEFKGRN